MTMTSDLTDCGSSESTCWTMPPEFVRMRYFFGQRLGVMELADEAAYHAGKHAFHNARLHGVGVLCGLRVERYVAPAGGTRTTVLRVSKGAAVDACGREVIVGADQCIDVAAWFARNKSRPELRDWLSMGARAIAPGTDPPTTLFVGLRYRECPSDPSPAPRDPCGCDNGGCEFGRVREGFELTLLTRAERDKLHSQTDPLAGLKLDLPPGADPRQPISITERLRRAVAASVAGNCPEPSTGDTFLLLGSLTVTLDATPIPVDLSVPDYAPFYRLSLLPTEALQEAVLGLMASAAAAGNAGRGLGGWPIQYQASAADAGTLSLGKPPPFHAGAAIVASTFDPSYVTVHRLDTISGWQPVTITATLNTDGSFDLTIPGGLSAGPRFRVAIDPPFHKPIADADGRAIVPVRFAQLFAFVADTSVTPNTLKLDPSVY